MILGAYPTVCCCFRGVGSWGHILNHVYSLGAVSHICIAFRGAGL